MARDLQNSPIIFWLLAAIAVGSLVFSVYTFQITKPSREFSYRIFGQPLSIPDEISSKISLTGPMGAFNPSAGHIKNIDIWNSGNLEIEIGYILKQINVKLAEEDVIIDVRPVNVSDSDFDAAVSSNNLALNLKKVLPKAGFKIYYYTKNASSSPSVEGLIADPIRGAITIKDASLIGYSFQQKKSEKWYIDLFFLIIIPFGVMGAMIETIEKKPATKRGRIIKNSILYLVAGSVIIFIVMQSYDIFIGSPPF